MAAHENPFRPVLRPKNISGLGRLAAPGPPLQSLQPLHEVHEPQEPFLVYTPHLPRKTLMEVMGVVHYHSVNSYVNFSRSERVRQFLNATPAVLGTRCSRRMRFRALLGGAISGWPGEAFEALLERGRTFASRKPSRGLLRYVLSIEDSSERD